MKFIKSIVDFIRSKIHKLQTSNIFESINQQFCFTGLLIIIKIIIKIGPIEHGFPQVKRKNKHHSVLTLSLKSWRKAQ